jgi:hypothetical protein
MMRFTARKSLDAADNRVVVLLHQVALADVKCPFGAED